MYISVLNNNNICLVILLMVLLNSTINASVQRAQSYDFNIDVDWYLLLSKFCTAQRELCSAWGTCKAPGRVVTPSRSTASAVGRRPWCWVVECNAFYLRACSEGNAGLLSTSILSYLRVYIIDMIAVMCVDLPSPADIAIATRMTDSGLSDNRSCSLMENTQKTSGNIILHIRSNMLFSIMTTKNINIKYFFLNQSNHSNHSTLFKYKIHIFDKWIVINASILYVYFTEYQFLEFSQVVDAQQYLWALNNKSQTICGTKYYTLYN